MYQVKLTSQDSGYIVVFVDGEERSRHLTTREADEATINAALADPEAAVFYQHAEKVVASVSIVDEEPDLPSAGNTDTLDTPETPAVPVLNGLRVEPDHIAVQEGDDVWLTTYRTYDDGSEKELYRNRYTTGDALQRQGPTNCRHFVAGTPGQASVRNSFGGFQVFAQIEVRPDDGSAKQVWGVPDNPEPEDEPDEPHDPSDSGDPTEGVPDEIDDAGQPVKRVIPEQPDCSGPRRAFTAAELFWRHTRADEKVDVRYLARVKDQPDAEPVLLTLGNAPVGVTPLLNPDGSNHDHLAVCRYSDCVLIEDIWIGNRDEFVGHLQIDVDDETIVDQEHTVYLNTRTAAIRKKLKQITPTRDWDPRLIPNYEVPAHMDSFAGFMTPERSGLNGLGMIYAKNLGSTGGKQYIGGLPGHVLPWLLKGHAWENGNAWEECRFGEDHAPVFPSHLRDPNNGRVADPSVHTAVSMHPNLMGQWFGKSGTNPVTRGSTCPNKADNAHYPQVGVAGYLSSGSDFDLEQVGFLAAYELFWGNPDYRNYEQCLANGQVRGQAWQLRSIMYYARLLPDDHPDKKSWLKIVSNNAKAYWNDTTGYAPGGKQHNYLGIIWGVIYPDAHGQFRGIGPWQQHHFASAVGLGVRMGFEEMRPLAEFSAGFAVKCMTRMCYLLGSIYSLNVIRPDAYIGRKKDQDPAHLIESWKKIEIDNFTVGHNGDKSDQLALPCAERDIGEGKGVMFNSNGNALSFPANLQPALAAGVDLGLEDAELAWDLFRANSVREERQDELDHIDYSQCATYSIVPDPSLAA